MTDEQLVAMHRLLAEYRKLATEALLDVHADLAQRLAHEAALIPRGTEIGETPSRTRAIKKEDGDVDNMTRPCPSILVRTVSLLILAAIAPQSPGEQFALGLHRLRFDRRPWRIAWSKAERGFTSRRCLERPLRLFLPAERSGRGWISIDSFTVKAN
jgi:hypothetical protein